MPTTDPTGHLRENQIVLIRGNIVFSRIASQLEHRKRGQSHIKTRPYRIISLVDARIIPANEKNLTIEERYVESKIFTYKKGKNTGRRGYSIEDTSELPPHVFEPKKNNPERIRKVALEGELANGLDVTIVLRTYHSGRTKSKSIGISQVVLHEPVRYCIDALKIAGVILGNKDEQNTKGVGPDRERRVQGSHVTGQVSPKMGAPSHLFDPVATFPAFYRNPVIQLLAPQARWTVSSYDKTPLNMLELMRTGRLWGAHEVSAECLVTLEELTRMLPDAANAAFHVDAQSDGIVVLDVEKTCPPELAAEMLKLPALYIERSMSGLGYHLILPLPQSFWDFPVAAAKRVLKGAGGHFEVLQHHWVTFTRHVEPTHEQNGVHTAKQVQAWEELWAQLAQAAAETPMAEFNVGAKEPEIPQKEAALAYMVAQPHAKTLGDFNHDASRFEFSVLNALYRHMRTYLANERNVNPSSSWDENQMVWLLYRAAQRALPHRSKHDTLRNGRPYLFNQAQRYLELSLAREAGAMVSHRVRPR
ncbi:hypothetical protein [Nocardiopsis synnemataformans]|uniref:hypothetical protein n=1 Tax=Nocardiopsis synnemataformans TaxID=61305 RepID=UPI003EB7A229